MDLGETLNLQSRRGQHCARLTAVLREETVSM
jgi:hypothetical protein